MDLARALRFVYLVAILCRRSSHTLHLVAILCIQIDAEQTLDARGFFSEEKCECKKELSECLGVEAFTTDRNDLMTGEAANYGILLLLLYHCLL